MNRLSHAGYSAYLVGGCIRDLLLHHVPKDFDVVTNAHPQQIRKLFRNCRLIGRRFRLAHIYFGREIIEVATFRSDQTHQSSQQHKSDTGLILRDNVYGEIHEDVWRRDITINALYYNITDASIIDFTSGYADINKKIIRLIGEPKSRYQEDPIRILRVIRLAAKLSFQLQEDTEKAIYSEKEQLMLVPKARLLNEIIKLYHSGKACTVQKMLQHYDLLKFLFPLLAETLLADDHEQAVKFLHQSLQQTDKRINDNKPVNPAFLFAVLLWHPLQRQKQALCEAGMDPLRALEVAMREIISVQNKQINITRRYSQIMREIWILQYRLPKRYGQQAFRVITHPRFRAGYDFLLNRAASGEAPIELADWWTQFQKVKPEQQQKMVEEVEENSRPRRRKRKPKPEEEG